MMGPKSGFLCFSIQDPKIVKEIETNRVSIERNLLYLRR